MAIPPRIAILAKAVPLARGSMEALIGQGWFDSVYGSGRTHRESVLSELARASDAFEAADHCNKETSTPANAAALAKAWAWTAPTRPIASFPALRS